MSFNSTLLAAVSAMSLALPALAQDITVEDPYARSSARNAKSGAAFMIIHNTGNADDRLIDARADVARKVELHTHKENAQGVMQMLHVPEGFDLPAGGMIEMKRGGHHVMFMGINAPFAQGDIIPLTLVFEKAGEMQVDVPVDLERKPMHGAMNHGQMKKASE